METRATTADEAVAYANSLANSVTKLEFERDEARRERDELMVALKAILQATREDAKGEQWTIRAYLDERGVFNDDISSSRRLVEKACEWAIAKAEGKR